MRGNYIPSLVAARWVGQNSGPIFAICGPKYTELSLPVCSLQSVFRLTISCYVPEIFAIKSRSCPKSRRSLMHLGRQISGGERGEEEANQISDRILKIWVTVEHVAKFGDDRPTSEIRRRKKRSKLQR